jgi:hypothetical protein
MVGIQCRSLLYPNTDNPNAETNSIIFGDQEDYDMLVKYLISQNPSLSRSLPKTTGSIYLPLRFVFLHCLASFCTGFQIEVFRKYHTDGEHPPLRRRRDWRRLHIYIPPSRLHSHSRPPLKLRTRENSRLPHGQYPIWLCRLPSYQCCKRHPRSSPIWAIRLRRGMQQNLPRQQTQPGRPNPPSHHPYNSDRIDPKRNRHRTRRVPRIPI